jgi:hypothetical protein
VGLSESEVKKERRRMGFLKKNSSSLAFKPNGSTTDGLRNVGGESARRLGGGNAKTGLAKSGVRPNPSGLRRVRWSSVCMQQRGKHRDCGSNHYMSRTLEKARIELGSMTLTFA